jgi:hypothetical protein
MTNAGNDRQEIRQVAKEQEPDWQCLPDGAKDLFHRGMHDVEVHYDASDTATLALRKRESTQIPPTVPGVGKAKPAAIAWLTNTQDDRV